MWPNPQETTDLVTLLKKSLMENLSFVLWDYIYSIIIIYWLWVVIPKSNQPNDFYFSVFFKVTRVFLWFMVFVNGLFSFLQEQGSHLGIQPPIALLHSNVMILPSTPSSSRSKFWLYLRVLCRLFSLQ